MAVSFVALTQSELDLAAADKPILSATPDPDALLTGKWVTNTLTGTTLSLPSDTDLAFPFRRLVDGLPGLVSKGSTTALTWTAAFRFTAADAISFDWVGILNHNLDTIGGDTIVLQVSDDQTFTTNVRTLFTRDLTTLLTDARFAVLDLFHTGADAIRYSGVEHARFQISLLGTGIPQIGQVVFGRRRQLQREPNRPWDPTNLVSELDRFESRAGVITDGVRHRGRRQIVANLNPNSEPFTQDIIDWYSDTNEGTLPFAWIDRPASAPDRFNLMKVREPSLDYPFVLFSTREFVLNAVEQGPNFLSQDP